ncbi:MAG TPA: PAS domain S-box protein [Candidatus Krumholzibacteria bacterium]|nr:PAS domain S-box protein [Candidatus Krumholzibacteria bacterium]HPD70307.1 PAS domain S-box protein [Candidatus Krumholzibacteria bacterium]HRY39993.1 PAS domain S-box protein [Candidatus Krumholzibacteria bacterium]
MPARFLTTLNPAPDGFAATSLVERELMCGTLVLLVSRVEEVTFALPGAAERLRGLVVTVGDSWRWRRLGTVLWHLEIPDLAEARDRLAGCLDVVEQAIASAALARSRDLELAGTRADLAATRSDYDVSVRRLAERVAEVVALNENLRESEERFRALVEASSDWIWEMNEHAIYTYSSPRVRDLLGYEPHAMLGRSFFELMPDYEIARVSPLYEAAARERRPFIALENVNRHRDGRMIVLETSAVPILDAQGRWKGYRGIDRDISRRRQDEQQRLDLERRILHAQKLESLGVLAGGIAHDFNNLLVAILGNAELAMIEMAPLAPGRDAVQDVRRAAIRASELTNQLLAYSGKGRFVIEDVDVSAVVSEMVRLLEVSVSKRARLVCDLAGGLPAVEADAAQLRQVVMNLVTNASEAIETTERDGTITLCVRELVIEPAGLPGVAIGEDQPAGRYVELAVTDTGCGMTPEVRDRLFDPFFTTKFFGRGLGLAAVQGIVRGHQGVLAITSAPDRGTGIRVLLPVAPGASSEAGDTSATAMPGWRGAGTALVIEDDDTVREVAARILTHLGYGVLAAENGQRGIDLFRARADEIAVVLLDLSMPVMDGEQTYRELRRLRSDVRVILVSGYDELEATRRFAGAGLAGFVKKPYTIEDLTAVLRRALGA